MMIQNGPLKVVSGPDYFSGGIEESSLETRLHTLKVGAQSYSFENLTIMFLTYLVTELL